MLGEEIAGRQTGLAGADDQGFDVLSAHAANLGTHRTARHRDEYPSRPAAGWVELPTLAADLVQRDARGVMWDYVAQTTRDCFDQFLQIEVRYDGVIDFE